MKIGCAHKRLDNRQYQAWKVYAWPAPNDIPQMGQTQRATETHRREAGEDATVRLEMPAPDAMVTVKAEVDSRRCIPAAINLPWLPGS